MSLVMMRSMRAVVLATVLSACSFDHAEPYVGADGGGGSGSGSGDGGMITPGIDGPACAWSYTPTNFDPCMLPAPGSLTVSGNQTLDPNTTTHPKQVLTQSDGTMITVIHLSELTVNLFSTLTI